MNEINYRPDNYNIKKYADQQYNHQEDILPLLLDFARYTMQVEIRIRHKGIDAYLEGVLVHDTDCMEGENLFIMVFHSKARICFDSKDVIRISEPLYLGHLWIVWLMNE